MKDAVEVMMCSSRYS